MGKYDKLLNKILRGNADTNIGFDELCQLLIRLGFEVRVKGSHHVFRKAGIVDLINLQKDGGKAKPYQVKQVRETLVNYNVVGSENEDDDTDDGDNPEI